jgi:hypothetical protein
MDIYKSLSKWKEYLLIYLLHLLSLKFLLMIWSNRKNLLRELSNISDETIIIWVNNTYVIFTWRKRIILPLVDGEQWLVQYFHLYPIPVWVMGTGSNMVGIPSWSIPALLVIHCGYCFIVIIFISFKAASNHSWCYFLWSPLPKISEIF